jgi:hypothetical protein
MPIRHKFRSVRSNPLLNEPIPAIALKSWSARLGTQYD